MIRAPQNTEAGRWLRSFSRKVWRQLWRAERITVRESMKVRLDTMTYGTGCLQEGTLGEWQRDGSDICRRLEPGSIIR